MISLLEREGKHLSSLAVHTIGRMDDIVDQAVLQECATPSLHYTGRACRKAALKKLLHRCSVHFVVVPVKVTHPPEWGVYSLCQRSVVEVR